MWFRHRPCTCNPSQDILKLKGVKKTDNIYSSSPPPVVLASLPPPLSSDSSSSPVSRTPTHPLPVPPRPSRTPSRLLSLPSPTPTVSSPPTSGRRPSSSEVPWTSSPILCARASDTRAGMFYELMGAGNWCRGVTNQLCFIA